MKKLFQENLDLKSEDLVAGLLQACDIKEPPTHEQLVFDFLKLKRETLPADLVSKFSATFEVDPEVRAILDTNEKRVFVHPDMQSHKERYSWASLHEVGHFVLPEHRELLYKCSWEDLSQLTQRRLENEANRFAADLIFQNDVFTKEAADSKLSMAVPISLKERYRASFEATIRRYVEKNPRPCALVVYRPTQTSEFEAPVEVQYSVRSPSWHSFAYIIPRQICSSGSPEHEAFYRMRPSKITRASLVTGNDRGSQTFPSELFSNTYKVFQLVLPSEKD